MTIEKKQAFKAVLKKMGKAVLSALPWICWVVALTCFFSLLFISADKSAERDKQLAALEAENAMYESVNARLDEEIDWLRSFIERVGIEEADDGQAQ